MLYTKIIVFQFLFQKTYIIMKTTLLKFCCAFILLFGTFSCSEDEDTIQTTSETLVVDEIFRLVNEHRQEQGLSTLEKSNVAIN